MQASFWLERWDSNQIGFHQAAANPLLTQYLPHLSLDQGSRIFVPLCGKTLDIAWLLSQGYSVVGVELSQKAIEQLFAELKVQPSITTVDSFNPLFSAKY